MSWLAKKERLMYEHGGQRKKPVIFDKGPKAVLDE